MRVNTDVDVRIHIIVFRMLVALVVANFKFKSSAMCVHAPCTITVTMYTYICD